MYIHTYPTRLLFRNFYRLRHLFSRPVYIIAPTNLSSTLLPSFLPYLLSLPAYLSCTHYLSHCPLFSCLSLILCTNPPLSHPPLSQITLNAMKADHDQIALQGIEFWSTVCDEEADLSIEAMEVGSPYYVLHTCTQVEN